MDWLIQEPQHLPDALSPRMAEHASGRQPSRRRAFGPALLESRGHLPTMLPIMLPIMLPLLAAAALAMGLAVYVAFRPLGTAQALPASLSLPGFLTDFLSGAAWPAAAALLGCLPSFLHSFAFSVLSACAAAPHRHAAGLACLGWALINTLAELGQHPALQRMLEPLWSEAAELGIPLAHALMRYLQQGRFDVFDIAAACLGAGCAWWLLARSRWSLPQKNPAIAAIAAIHPPSFMVRGIGPGAWKLSSLNAFNGHGRKDDRT